MKYFIIICVVISWLSFGGCQSSMYRVFSAQESKEIKKEYPYLEIVPPFWTPKLSNRDIDRIANNVYDVVAKNYNIDISKYQFQLLGTSIGSNKIIFLNFFKVEPVLNKWELGEYVFTFDGGKDFLQAMYDIKKNEVINILINDEA